MFKNECGFYRNKYGIALDYYLGASQNNYMRNEFNTKKLK
jgi:hypothetical protein